MFVQRTVSRLARVGGAAVCGTRPLRSSFQPNLTSLTNQLHREEHARIGGAREEGIPRISRLRVRPIAVLHESHHVMIVGRNFCNGFSSNQYLVVNKQNQQCIFVDACDDWPDDWVAFLSSSNLKPTHVFLTHCHVDNVINLNALLGIVEHHTGVRMGIMWCPAEQPWVEQYQRACHRYARVDESRQPLPMLRSDLHSHCTYAHEFHSKQNQQQHRQGAEDAKPPPRIRERNLLLSCATNRATSFYEFGSHNVLHYLFTPGHSPGHMMLSLPRERLLFTGDVLFYNQVGRVDLPHATGERLSESLLALEDFPDATVLLPGHGRLTTLGRERRESAALRSLYERRGMGKQEVLVGFNTGYL